MEPKNKKKKNVPCGGTGREGKTESPAKTTIRRINENQRKKKRPDEPRP